jgi:hypothetical protein
LYDKQFVLERNAHGAMLKPLPTPALAGVT